MVNHQDTEVDDHLVLIDKDEGSVANYLCFTTSDEDGRLFA